MRRMIAIAATVALAAGGVLSAPAYADDASATPELTAPTATPAPTEAPTEVPVETVPLPVIPEAAAVAPAPRAALTTARRVLAGRAVPRDPSATVALRDLWMARTRLTGAERRQADALLARPTDGANDPQGFGYTAPSTVACNTRLCIHSVQTPGNVDYADPAFVAQSLQVMDSVWTSEVDSFGYRAPLTDGVRGGSPLFDVYLKDLGGQLYGYCAAESAGPKRTARGFCVLDNDFSPTQFPTGTQDGNLRVTAAHEFFHAVQYAYDYAEDPWMMESTATWMEERIASDVDDNRQYLTYSQLYAPYVPLDVFASNSFYQYGNWIFWEYLSTRYGNSIVNKAWREAGTLRRDGGKYSFEALQKVLKRKGGLTKNFAQFAGSNLVPAVAYPEGAFYAAPKVKRTKVLTKGRRGKRYAARLFHMSSSSFRFVPGKGLSAKKWRLALRIAGPDKRTAPAAHVVVHHLDGRVQRKFVKLNRRGDRSLKVAFAGKKIAAVSVTLVNASTRMRCGRRTVLACGGRAIDDRLRFAVSARAVKGR